MLQALYFCRPFREKVLAYKEDHQSEGQEKGAEGGGAGTASAGGGSAGGGSAGSGSAEAETLLSVLGDLFVQIATYKKKFGVIHPKKFISKVKKENS